MIESKGLCCNVFDYNHFVVRVLITIKNMQWARSIKKQGERERAEISLFTN
jgi:hypothetical protein